MKTIKQFSEKKLSYKERQGLSTSQFALPGKGSGPEGKQGGSYPIPDESHARNALARVSQHGSEAEKAKVRAAVRKKFPGIEVSEEKDKPDPGKIYALTGRSDQPSIARGDSWKKSLVTKKRKEQDAKKEDVSEGPLQDRRQAQSKKRQAMDALRRKQVQQKQLASRAAKEKEKSDIESRRDIRTAQASKHAQKNWRAEATDIVDAVAAEISAGFDPRTHKVPRPAGMSKKQFDYKYKPQKVRKPKKDTGMKTPETQAALKYLKGKGLSPYGPGGKYEPKKEEVEMKEGEWADEKRKEKESSDRLLKIHKEREARYQMQQRKKRQAKEEVVIDELTVDQKKKREASRERTHGGKSGGERKGLFHGSVDSYKRMAHTAARGVKKVRGEEVEIKEGPPTPKFKPLRHPVWSADASIPAGARPKNPGKIPKYKVKKSGFGSGAPINIKAEYEHDCKQSHPGMTHPEWEEDQKIESTYSQKISASVPEGNASGAKGSKKKELFKARKFRNTTPGQSRDFERLSAARMFQAYEQKTDEEMPATNTSGVAIRPTIIFKRKRKVDGRTKDYKETVQRVQARRDAVVARELEQKLNMFGVSSNPFKEETEMENNNKYLKTKEGSIEQAVLKSLMTETPVNPNDERPTLHLPKKKYLTIKEGSLENAVANVMYEKGEVSSVGTPLKHKRSWDTKTHKLIVDPRKGKGVKVVPKHVRGDPAEEVELEDYSLAPKGKGSKAAKLLYGKRTGKNRVQPESAAGRGERDVGSQEYTDYVKDLTPGQGRNIDAISASIKASHQAKNEKKLRTTRIDDEYQVDELDQKQMPTIKIAKKLKPKSLIPPNKTIPEKGLRAGGMHYPMGDKRAGGVKEAAVTGAEAGHATALYKDQWKDRKIADYDKEHGRDSRAKEMRKDAEVDRKRMWGLTKDKWKHAKYATGEEEGKKSVTGNTPDPKDAYKKEAFSGTPNTTHDPKMGQSIAIDPLEDKERVRKLPKGATTKALQKKQVKTAPPGSTSEEAEIDVPQILASKVREEVIVGLLDMGILGVNENTETGFEVINQPEANRENLLRMAYNTGAKILDEIHSAKDTSHLDKALAAFKKKGGKVTQVKSKGIPKWAKAAHQKSGPPSAHRQYKPGSGKSEEVE